MLNQSSFEDSFYTFLHGKLIRWGFFSVFFFFLQAILLALTNKKEGKSVTNFLILTYTSITAKLTMSHVFSLLILNKLVWTHVNYKVNTNIPKLYNALQFAMAPIQKST